MSNRTARSFPLQKAMKHAFASFVAATAVVLIVLSAGADTTHTSRDASPRATSCSADCDRKAADCLEGCEERFKTDDRARVTCKFECANTRQACDKNCN